MARSMQKIKFLATQCAVAGSPTRSPTTSPVFQLRRRKTLRMFLSRSGGASNRRLNRNQEELSSSSSSSDQKGIRNVEEVDSSEKNSLISKKLKDLFVSSPPLNDERGRNDDDDSSSRQVLIDRVCRSINRRSGGRNRHLSAAFRYRLLRRPWRPVLFTIPE